MKNLKLFSIVLLSVLLISCAALGTAISHRHLETQTLMSNSIFLPPGATLTNKTIFVDVHNTTDKQIHITQSLKAILRERGYFIVSNPSQAHFILQVNLLQIGKNSESAAKEMMATGYGGALEGALSGGALAYVANINPVQGGLVGGTAIVVANNLVQNVTYSGIVDVKVTLMGSKHRAYKTRILILANQVNLDFKDALPSLEEGITHSIAGILS